ncbi:MAG: hypothetical protein AB7I96_12370, partial [Candidatus Dadabacteria bacterium]
SISQKRVVSAENRSEAVLPPWFRTSLETSAIDFAKDLRHFIIHKPIPTLAPFINPLFKK